MRLADRLNAARRRGFVGRAAELAGFGSVLAGGDAPRVVYVHGPGGVGKTALLHQYAWLGERAGRRCVWLDTRDLPRDSDVLLDRIGAPADDLLLLVDGAEGLDALLREELLPRLPADAVTVLSGRERPAPAWRTDPGWRELVQVVPLGNLEPAEGLTLLAARGVAEPDRAAALEFTRGHPLALALVADVAAQRRFTPAEAPEVVKSLLRGLVDTVPTPGHRLALEGCALVLGVTEPLLAALLGRDDAGELFEWLRGLSIMEHGQHGLFPHDLVRDVLAAELRWRDPAAHAQMHSRAVAYYRDRFDRADADHRSALLLDFLYLHRDRSVLAPFLGPVPGGIDFWAGTPHPEDWAELRSWVDRWEGREAAEILDHWLQRQPDAFATVRDGRGEAVGMYAVLRLEETGAADRRADPALAGLPAGETARLVRFWMARDHYQDVSEVQTFLTLQMSRICLSVPGLTWTYLAFADPGFWAEGCSYLDYHRLPAADFSVGGRAFGIYGHDWREVPPLEWLALLAGREGDGHAGPDREAFGRAVKEALRSLGRAEGLRGSPLLETALVPPGLAEAERVPALREAIAAAAAELEASPLDLRAFRALHHTYLRPASTQQAAADLLGLPMSTFRRHLAEGVSRLTELLWRRIRTS